MERWRITAGHVPGPFGLVLVLVAVVLAIAEAARAYRKPVPGVSPRLRAALFALRCAGALCLLAVALELSLSFETTSAAGPRLVVLVDDSASMGVADAESPGSKAMRRIDRVRELWRRSEPARAAWKEQGLAVQVRRFGEGSEPLTGDAEATLDLAARQPASDLTRAFAELAAIDPAVDPRPLAGVIVISDGLFDRADRGADDPLVLAARELGVPVTAVAAGAPHLVDLALTELRAGEFAFVENVVEFSADIEAHGLEGTRTEVVLRRDGQVVATEPFVAPASGITTVRFEVAPDRVGQFVYEIEVRPVEGEASPHNNRRAFVVKVLRDKVRALHVAGRPDWDVRALRTLLGRDPNVELLSYYILRGADDADREDPFAPLSLIAFPTDELFKEQLGSFDLVILHNFDALNHQVGRYLPDIGRYVEEGGALVMIGGDMGLATGDYPAPALSAVVPVDLRVPTGLDTEAFKPAVTDAGRRHPITAWIDHSGLSDWSALPPLDSYNPAKLARHEAQIGSAVLLRHPEGGPLLTIAEPGRGRVLVLSTGASGASASTPTSRSSTAHAPTISCGSARSAGSSATAPPIASPSRPTARPTSWAPRSRCEPPRSRPPTPPRPASRSAGACNHSGAPPTTPAPIPTPPSRSCPRGHGPPTLSGGPARPSAAASRSAPTRPWPSAPAATKRPPPRSRRAASSSSRRPAASSPASPAAPATSGWAGSPRPPAAASCAPRATTCLPPRRSPPIARTASASTAGATFRCGAAASPWSCS
ncbi:hypothetical protein OV079_18620 [Nannocystis pusilla]|uniref:Glutamine amidotransferase domain-containing protein n=1 Tax=Nannocystis pusilla TaxID=889268 RepID=A0A9X3EQG9_9BACT|nr:hypothetical protein [Nannocystis pusilla]MCY1007524.1 hypothetical protein [Nannocystis pusilla]